MTRILCSIALFFVILPTAGAGNSLDEMWNAYVHSDFEKAKSFVDKRDYAFFINAIIPGSHQSIEIKAKKTIIISENLGQLIFDFGNFTTWLAAKKDRLNGNWLLTLDEKPVLDVLTSGWTITEFKPLRYHTPKSLTQLERDKALQFRDKVKEYDRIFGYTVPVVDYYSCPEGPLAEKIVGEIESGAGKGRYRVIKAIGELQHAHELAHVFALEIGFIGPFFDEGIATALGSHDLIKDRKSCESAKELLNRGLVYFLSGENFTQAHRQGKNVYGLAQLAMKVWINDYGFEKVKTVLKEGFQNGGQLQPVIERHLGKISRTELKLKEILNKRCQ